MSNKSINNVNVLDITSATEESIAEITRINNVNVVLFSRETAKLIPQLTIKNINITVEVPVTYNLTMGQLTIHTDTLPENNPGFHIVLGQLLIEPGIKPDDIRKIFDELVVIGQVIYPANLTNTIQPKLKHMMGETVTYPPDSTLITGNLKLDITTLSSMQNNTSLVVTGNLTLPNPLPNEILEQKLNHIQVLRHILCPVENSTIVRSKLANGSPQMDIIPSGYALMEKPVLLNENTIEALPGANLYCTGDINISNELTEKAFDRYLEHIISKDIIICPNNLRKSLAGKCDLLNTRVIFYEDPLLLIEETKTLSAAQFRYIEGAITIINHGDLTIAPNIDPELLHQRLNKVHNFGTIICTSDQQAAIEARAGVNEGVIIHTAATEENNNTDIRNVNHLKL